MKLKNNIGIDRRLTGVFCFSVPSWTCCCFMFIHFMFFCSTAWISNAGKYR